MKLSLKIAKILIRLKNGEVIPASSAKHQFIELLITENIILRKGKHKRTLQLRDPAQLSTFISNQLQIKDLKSYITALENKNTSRSELVHITTDSKTIQIRSFKGFLVNCFCPIQAKLNNDNILIKPRDGSFIFIYDYESFIPEKNVTVVGIENPANFAAIRKQKYLFENISPLFLSRYPQTQNKDVIKWLKSIPNNYIHFGDLDIAGIGVYLNEYKKHLGNKAKFFVPKNFEKAIKGNGNRERYDKQKINFATNEIQEQKLKQLLKVIQRERKGLDQEYYIQEKDKDLD